MKHHLHYLILFMTALVCETTVVFAQRQINKSFKGVNTLNVNSSKGNCKIIKSKNAELSVLLTTHYESDSVPEYSLVQTGNVLTIDKKFHPRSVQGVIPEWVLIVPENITISFKTSAGSIGISGLKANLNVSTGKGELFLSNVRGTIKGHTGSGNITVKESSGTINLQTGKGHIHVSNTTGNFSASSAKAGVTKTFINH